MISVRHSHYGLLRYGVLRSAAGLFALACATLFSRAQQPPYVTPHAPLLGSAWYPEQWPESHWDADLTLMEQAHFNVVRIGEFAWSTMEPSEGHYDFGWLDRAIALAEKHHIEVVLGTPTDAPPAWLTSKYPQTLRFDENGKRAEHGGRRQFNYASPLYRKLCAAVVTEMARRYGRNPAVIGWQIGNEYTDESFDPETRALFQQFLRERYKTLDSLNAHWTTAYWSQTYTAWSQIPLELRNANPGLLLEHKHFVTATWRSFQRNQIDVLRPRIDATQFITTNIGGLGWSDNWDHYAMTADLDLSSWDDYVGQGHLDVAKNAMMNDFVRGWKRQNFWLMETQPGSVNWAPVNNALAPGETRALAWQAVGHGADAVLYWQWRSALNGQEQYHGAVVGPDGKPQPLYPELQQLGSEFASVQSALAGTTPHAETALLYSYDSRWAIGFQQHTRLYDQQQVLLRFYKPLEQAAESTGGAVDIVDPNVAPLDTYKLLVAPSLNVIDDALAAKLTAWVQAGGHLLLGPRSGMKDDYDALHPQRQPGPLAETLGAKVDQYYALDANVALMPAAPQPAAPGTADAWAEALRITNPATHEDFRYSDPGGWLDQQPAMVTRTLGKGTISYLGTLPDATLLAGIVNQLNPATPHFSLPQGVELCVRSGPGKGVAILINHNAKPTTVNLPQAVTNLLSPSQPSNHLSLPPQGVAVFALEPTQ